MKTYVVGTHWNRLAEAIPMSTHNLCFYRELMKIIFELSSNTLFICFTEYSSLVMPNGLVSPCTLDEPICRLRGVRSILFFISFYV